MVPQRTSLIFANMQMSACCALVGPIVAVPSACRIGVSPFAAYSFKNRFATANWRYSCTVNVIHRLVPLTPTACIVLWDVFATEICTLWHLYHGGRRIFVWGDLLSSMR